MRRKGWRLTAYLTLCTVAGCGHTHVPGQADVVPGLRNRQGVYADVNPRWSHDGKRIAFMRATTDRHLQLYVVDEDLDRPLSQTGSALLCPDRPYDSDLRRYCSPDTLTWSPDDRQIAFEQIEWFTFEDGQRLPGTGLWSLDTYSRKVMPLALHPEHYLGLFYYFHAPQWSPDGRYLAFVGEGINGQRTIYVRPLAAMAVRKVLPRFDNYEDSDWPVWRPFPAGSAIRGRQPTLVFRQGIDHPTAGSDTETLRRIVPGGEAGTARELWRLRDRDYAHLLSLPPDVVLPRTGHLSWSPDGRQVAFTLTPDANDYDRYEVWVMNFDGSAARRVSPHDGRGYIAPVWIDDNHLGALSPETGEYRVVALDLNTRHARRIGMIPSADCDWSPDRTRIVYALPGGTSESGNSPTTLRLFATHVGRRQLETATRR
jgi:dipeptidyl aminopeptidase/acylaminoacyl peptidase